MNFAQLKTIAEEQGENTLAYLNEPVDADAGVIDRRSIKLVLLGRNKLTQVTAAVPLFATDPDFSKIRISDPLTQSVFAQLLQANVITQEDLDAVNALGVKQVPRWQSMGFLTPPHQGDIDWALAHY